LEIINLVNDGIVVYDAKGVVGLINRIAMKILDLTNESNIIIQSEISNKNLHHFLVHADLENHILHLDSATYLLSKREIGMTGHFLLTIKNMRERINMENRLRSELKKQGYRAKYQFSDIIYGSKVLGDLITKSKKLAESEFNILIYGESGTGKEIFAGAIHNASLRKNGPFFAVNFSSLPDDLIESELFGYEEGAFTGAKKGGKVGLFELANQGTLFLDEIGDTSLKIQSRLLRVLQEREILKVGGTKNIPVDVRIIAATNKNLMEVMKQGRFREDLYYRIKKLYFQIPPLRQRREDILPLFKHFLVQKNGFMIPVAEEVKQLLRDYDWPGNVRELENAVEYILSLSAGDVIETSMLPEDMLGMATVPRAVPDGLVLFLLQNINRFNAEQVLVGRKKLSLLSQDSPFVLSEQQLRKVLGDLAARGLVQMGRGRVGVRLTGPGRAYLEQGNG
jgi:transcriptional regulator with PAS, ATPase and Fis domain